MNNDEPTNQDIPPQPSPKKWIKTEWENYFKQIFPGVMPSLDQVNETRQAFYAGVIACQTLLAKVTNENMAAEEGAEFLNQLHAECEDFHRLVWAEHKHRTESPELLRDMNQQQLSAHLNKQLRVIDECQTPDTAASILLLLEDGGIGQYGATRKIPEAPAILRELADRLEKNSITTR